MAESTPTPPPPPAAPVVLGIDPGTRVTGYGALVDCAAGARLLAAGEVRPAGKDAACRLADLRREIDELCAELSPRVVVVESAFFARNVQSALRLGEARGVILSCAARAAIEVVEYAPSVARKTLLGQGNAGKEQVAARVAALLGLEQALPLDTSDALSLALAHCQRGRTPAALALKTSRSRLRT